MIAIVLTLLVAAIHAYITALEMLLWETKRGRRIFGTTPEFAAQTKALAFNQGLYNGFLAAGLLVGLISGIAGMVIFLLICVAVAGIVGALSGLRRALHFQTVPAALALCAMVLGL